MASLETFSCAFCEAEKDKLLKCSRCKSIWYCNRDCQRSDWKVHKMVCIKAVENDTPSLSNVFQMNIAKVADFVRSQLNKTGFCILNDFLPMNIAEDVLQDVLSLGDSGSLKDGQLSGGLTSSEDSEKYCEKRIRGDKITWIEGNEPHALHIKNIMEQMDNLVLHCSDTNHKLGGYDIQGRTKAMVACYPGQQTGYIRHVDNPDGDGRCVTVLFYLNKGWTKKNGGKLRISKANMEFDIEPVFNRLVLFWSDKRTPHEVLPSNSMRYAITMWYFDKSQREQAKMLQKHKAMGEFGFEVIIKDLESRKNERDQAQLKLNEESERLVKNLMNDEELDAMAELIKGHDNPREMLAIYGISPSILDALLRVLNARMQ